MLIMYSDMTPRSKSSPCANPRSCMTKLYGVAREHKKHGFKMAPFTIAMQMLQGMLQKYVEDNDTDHLAPARKNPLQRRYIESMRTVPDGTTDGKQLTVHWREYFWVAVDTTFAVLAETGMRKGDVSRATAATKFKKGRLTFAKLKWNINGTHTAAPTPRQLHGFEHGGCWLVFGALKNDAFGEFFGSKPAWMEYVPGENNACAALIRLELAAAKAGLEPSLRASTPLFGPALGVEWYHSLIERVFYFLLRKGVPDMTDEEAKGFSLHSFRIYLACALYAAGCPNAKIMAILRWKSEEALLIYARMNDSERTDWVNRARTATVDSVVAAHLPRLDADEWVATLRDSLRSGALGKDAKKADLAMETGTELDELDAE